MRADADEAARRFAEEHIVESAPALFQGLARVLAGDLDGGEAFFEQVLSVGSERQAYAESILKTCRLVVESPLACVSGVTGADLKKRIEHIMTNDTRSNLKVWKKCLLAAAGSLVWWLIIFGTIAWQRVSTQYAFTVAVSPDGVRIRRGLLGTVAETIPVPRIQAVRMIEPLVWRPLHWCRLEVDVAGHLGRDHPEGSGAVRKALLPVGRQDEARRLLAIALPAAAGWPALSKPPRRSWWKAPLSYHFLAAGHDGTLAVSVVGRLRRETTWVPLAKAQSVRLVQGPLQRRLGLATVHLDAAGRRVRAEFRERSQEEATSLVGELAALSRSARRQASLAAAGLPVRLPANGEGGGAQSGDAGQAASVVSPANASQSEA